MILVQENKFYKTPIEVYFLKFHIYVFSLQYEYVSIQSLRSVESSLSSLCK